MNVNENTDTGTGTGWITAGKISGPMNAFLVPSASTSVSVSRIKGAVQTHVDPSMTMTLTALILIYLTSQEKLGQIKGERKK